MSKYTKQELIDWLKKIEKLKGKRPAQPDTKKYGAPSPHTYIRYFGSWHNALKEAGIVSGEKYTRKEYTREELSNYIFKYLEEFGVAPRIEDLANNDNYPDPHWFVKEFGSHQKCLDELGIIKERYINRKYTKEDLINFLHTYYKKYNKPPTGKGLNADLDFPSLHTYTRVFGSFEIALKSAGYFDMRDDKYLFRRKNYTDKELLDILHNYIKQTGEIPKGSDFNRNDLLPSSVTYVSRFGGFTNALNLLGYTERFKKAVIKTREEKINDIRLLYKQLGKTPTRKDIDDSSICVGYSAYYTEFKGYYQMLDACGIPYEKLGHMMTDQEIIDEWYQLTEDLGHYPTREPLRDRKILSPIMNRWGSYYNFLKDIGIEINKYTYKFRIYFSKINKTKCFSQYELKITNWLEANNIVFDKEIKYKEVIPSITNNWRFDWVISIYDKTYFVEMFGIEKKKAYDIKTKQKIEDCKNAGLNLIAIYPEDFKTKSLDEIFSFLHN